MKSVYIYLVPKSKWPGNIQVMRWPDSDFCEVYKYYDGITGKILGFNFPQYSSIEVNGVDIEKELKSQKGKRWMAEASRILSSKKNGTGV